MSTPVEYDELLAFVYRLIGHKNSTTGAELQRAGEFLLGTLFQGVFTSDDTTWPTSDQPVQIRNSDRSGQPGSHWVAFARAKNGDLVHYDSFGRKWKGHASRGAIDVRATDADRDAEQREEEENCGQRAIAWCCLFVAIDPDLAMTV